MGNGRGGGAAGELAIRVLMDGTLLVWSEFIDRFALDRRDLSPHLAMWYLSRVWRRRENEGPPTTQIISRGFNVLCIHGMVLESTGCDDTGSISKLLVSESYPGTRQLINEVTARNLNLSTSMNPRSSYLV